MRAILRACERPVNGVAMAIFVALAAACAGSNAPTQHRPTGNFATALAGVPDAGYTMYWLGEEFEAGGLVFRGPQVSDFGINVEGGGVLMDYQATVGNLGETGLGLELFSEAAWAIRSEALEGFPNSRDIVKDVSVGGRPARLVIRPGNSSRPINNLVLDIEADGTFVRAIAASGGGQPDVNPLIDEATFLAVMGNLRPYPE